MARLSRAAATEESTPPLRASDLFPDLLGGGGDIILHEPITGAAADLLDKGIDHADATVGVADLRMELHAVELPGGGSHGGGGAGIGEAGDGEALRNLGDVVSVAHPGDAFLREALKEDTVGIQMGDGAAVFPGVVFPGLGDDTAQGVGHQLAAVANAQYGDAHFKNLLGQGRGAFCVNTVGAAGEDDADGAKGPNVLYGGLAGGMDLAVHMTFPHPAGNELIVLTAEVQDQNFLHK